MIIRILLQYPIPLHRTVRCDHISEMHHHVIQPVLINQYAPSEISVVFRFRVILGIVSNTKKTSGFDGSGFGNT